MLRLCGIILLLSGVAFLLRAFGWRGAPVFAAVSAVVLLSESGEVLSSVFGSVTRIAEAADIAEPVGAALKLLGLTYLFGICADICRELGEAGIAKAAEVVGRVEIIAVVLPYFEKIIELGVGLAV